MSSRDIVLIVLALISLYLIIRNVFPKPKGTVNRFPKVIQIDNVIKEKVIFERNRLKK